MTFTDPTPQFSMARLHCSSAYDLIQRFYGDRCAESSGEPLMLHIDEGCRIIREAGEPIEVAMAFAVHPLFQDNEPLLQNHKLAALLPQMVVLLAMEYRRAANAYLCRPNTDHFTDEDAAAAVCIKHLLPGVRAMLLADKRQNQASFRRHHLGKHARSAQLEAYFERWLRILGDGMSGDFKTGGFRAGEVVVFAARTKRPSQVQVDVITEHGGKKWRRTLGSDLKVGDVIRVWWAPGTDQIDGLQPYKGVFAHGILKGAMSASFALNRVGMTIEAGMPFDVLVVEPK